jgi:GNAT superfamily N-acetyltransferase
MTEISFTFQRAVPAAVPEISDCVLAAYRPWMEIIGKPPGPMLDNYAQIVRDHRVWLAKSENRTAGVLVLKKKEYGLLLDNVAVHPDFQGLGLGRRLLGFAEDEAGRLGYKDLHLYSHELMVANLEMYRRWGYVETERKNVQGYDRVYMKKHLA